MKLEVIKREISDIIVTDDDVTISLDLQVSHGRTRKSVTPISIEHTVTIEGEIPEERLSGIDEAIALAVAGVKQRADLALNALKQLDTL